MKFVAYQEYYINDLAETALKFLNDPFRDKSTIVFKAPTGSGKTFMISQALSKLVKGSKEKYSFIWISVNSLHEQSRQNLLRYLEGERLLDCISIDELQNKKIEENQIVFFNWDSLIKENNIFRMENENDWNLQSLISNTKDEGREIILVIDESHRTARAEKAQDVIEEIKPKLVLEITATPKRHLGTEIEIQLGKVIAEGMIKSEVQINPGAHNIKENKDLLEIALKKRKQLKALYESMNIDINPLLLIQIPNKKSTDSTDPEDYIISLLAEFNITVSNKKLAIWLSEKKENKESVELNNSSVDVLIFKEAIALGWDCPRASILFLQREWNKERYVFNVQTLGRIMRMPEQKHYLEKPALNVGYVFSGSDNFEIVQELAGDYVSTLQMERDEDLIKRPFKIHSEFIRRKRELTRLSGDFKKCLFEAAMKLNTKDNININAKEIIKVIGIGGVISSIDEIGKVDFEKPINVKKDIREITDSYSVFCGEMSSPYAKARSTQIIKSSIRSWFKETFGIGDEDQIAIIVMQFNNNPKFKLLVESAKEAYQQLPTKSEEVITIEDWQIPESVSIFTDFVELSSSKKSIIKDTDKRKFFVKKNKNNKPEISEPERKFIEALENTDDELQWWFKNYYGESKYFGIAYKQEKNGWWYGFYPDFILKTKKETLIIEIKDDKDFIPINFQKLIAGQNYIERYKGKHTENVRFHILAPIDYDNFFQLLKDQGLESFSSIYEERLLLHSVVTQKEIENKADKSEKDISDLELLEELDKTINELKDTKLKNDLLKLSLQHAEENLETILKNDLNPGKTADLALNIPIPFNICVLGEVSDQDLIIQELQNYFRKFKVETVDWDIKFFNNIKLQNKDILRSLIRGQSRYNLIITGQIHHHSSKGNKKANILSELEHEKYVTHIVGSPPQNLLTPDKLLKAINSYLFS